MESVNLLNLLLSLVAGLFTMLIALLGWLGNKIYQQLADLNHTLGKVERDLHDRITGLDLRVTSLETRCDIAHVVAGVNYGG